MTCYRLALIGFGGVNRALAGLIYRRNAILRSELGFSLSIVGVSDLRFGSVVAENGLDLRLLAEAEVEPGGFARLPGGNASARNELVVTRAPADIVVEATYTNPVDGEPALSFCRLALEAGKHVVTTNKGPVALAGKRLKALATQKGLAFEYEGTVMSGTPVIRMARRLLTGSGLRGFEGILNGTSNFVLDRMASGVSFDEAVREAQELGYAEADPTSDVEGHDVRLKVAILANELLHADISPSEVECQGIVGLTSAEIAEAARSDRRWKLVGFARRAEDARIVAGVAPRALPISHPLARAAGATNAVSFETELLGSVTVAGPGAGRTETAYALLSDIIAIHREYGGTSYRGAA